MSPSTHLFCVGTAKSGTHSIASLFEDHLRTLHEAESELVITSILDFIDGRINREQLVLLVRDRDKRLRLEVDSSQLNYFLLDILLQEFADAKFILTIRDCYSWIDSFINHQLAYKSLTIWDRLRDLRFRPDQFQHSEEESILKEHGLYTLDGYLSYWADHNRNVLQKISSDRLFIVRTDEISRRVREMAAFAGVTESKINQEKSHAFKAAAKYNILSRIPPNFLEEKVNVHCRTLMDQLFPAVKTARDVLSGIQDKS